MTQIIRTKIEAKVTGDQRLMAEMILDESGVSVAARFLMLSRIWSNKGGADHPKAVQYKEEFSELFEAVLSTVRYDTGQSGEEPSDFGDIDDVRFMT